MPRPYTSPPSTFPSSLLPLSSLTPFLSPPPSFSRQVGIVANPTGLLIDSCQPIAVHYDHADVPPLIDVSGVERPSVLGLVRSTDPLIH